MPRLDCNLVPSPPSDSGRKLLLGLLIMALAAALVWRENLLDRIEEGQQKRMQQQQRTERALQLSAALPKPVMTPETASELNRVAAELTRNWEAPLDSLRRAAGNQVTLDKIRPETDTDRISIQGHAAGPGDYLRFLQRLQASPDWRHVLPVSDEPETGNGTAATGIRFELNGHWSGS